MEGLALEEASLYGCSPFYDFVVSSDLLLVIVLFPCS